MAYADALKEIQALIRSTETLAALGALAKIKSGAIVADPNTHTALEQVVDAVDPAFFDDLSAEELSFLWATAYGNLSRVFDLVAHPDKPGNWDYSDPTVLEAQGKSSRAVTRFLNAHAQEDTEFRALLEGGARILDVGSGVGWISITLAESWPHIHVDGLEILPPALERAQINLANSEVSDRVRFLDKNVTELDEEERYDVIFVPMMFIPESALRAAMPRLCRALRPGGFLIVGNYRLSDDPLMRALNGLQTCISGGRVWDEEEIGELLLEYGFKLELDVAPGMPISLHPGRRIR
ncbi:cyclopropane-fatty-acyl-phospholipid synthase family protein [Aliiroseovarius sp. PrR006]|uniref:SAM-dependent methyltransferase n=1 Tax=Aliiroseovarius sp. PrR006 TaxID=2706883 RepID=UPI0013D198B4|nr:class I SAM-dependent methyltransferase [Aliiroseovarius sp. PrR006]NDW54808.1 class I SAM-dependent methyltransferase [Aliiroseovarius sp. PrR006]